MLYVITIHRCIATLHIPYVLTEVVLSLNRFWNTVSKISITITQQ